MKMFGERKIFKERLLIIKMNKYDKRKLIFGIILIAIGIIGGYSYAQVYPIVNNYSWMINPDTGQHGSVIIDHSIFNSPIAGGIFYFGVIVGGLIILSIIVSKGKRFFGINH